MMTTYTKADLALVSGMNKDRLREGCKGAGVKGYGNMKNDQMRKALQNHIEANMAQVPETKPEDMPVQQSASAEPVVTTTPPAEAPAPEAPAAAHAEKPKPEERISRNGITRPGPGKCRDVWDALDALKAQGKEITFDAVRELAGKDMADATIRTQRQRWNKYTA